MQSWAHFQIVYYFLMTIELMEKSYQEISEIIGITETNVATKIS